MTEHLKSHYEKPAEMYDGLRLHQNENTEGCSPKVLEALARLTRENMGFYPPYSAVTDAAARYFGVPARVYHTGPYTIMVWNKNLLKYIPGREMPTLSPGQLSAAQLSQYRLRPVQP